MHKVPAKFTLVRLKSLQEKASALPWTIIDKEDYPDFLSSEEKKREHDKKYDKKRDDLLQRVDELCLEVRGFIKIVYGKESEYFSHLHKIDFTTESKGFIMNTYNDGHNQYWQQGRKAMIDLLTNIESEEQERAKLEQLMIDKTLPLRIGGFATVLVISLLSIWMMPPELMSKVFVTDKIFAAKLGLSVTLGCLAMIILSRENWKEFLMGGVIAGGLTLIGLVKPDEVKSPVKSQSVDSVYKVQKTDTLLKRIPANKAGRD